MKRVILLLAFTCSGCIPLRTKDSIHHVVIGFGVVSTPRQPEEQPQVIKTQYLGIMASQEPGAKLGIGYGSNIATIVPTNRNVVIEVSDGFLQPVKVRTHEQVGH